MKRRGNQYDWSIESRCGCAHENERWVTRFSLSTVRSIVWNRKRTLSTRWAAERRKGYLGAVHVWSTFVYIQPERQRGPHEQFKGAGLKDERRPRLSGSRLGSARSGRALTVRFGTEGLPDCKSWPEQHQAPVRNTG